MRAVYNIVALLTIQRQRRKYGANRGFGSAVGMPCRRASCLPT